MISNLAGRARSWAYGLRLADPKCFPSLEALKKKLRTTFEPPQNEFRIRTEFLNLKQGRMSLHDYIQKTRFLASSVVVSPIDMATQVTTFMGGLRDGPVKTYLFREYPESLEEAFSIALREEFSARLNQSFSSQRSSTTSVYQGPEPMDLSVVRSDQRPSSRFHRRGSYAGDRRRLNGVCHRCQKPGHFAALCRAPTPVPASASVTAVADSYAKNDNVQ
jgi:Retrotransposon gag protein